MSTIEKEQDLRKNLDDNFTKNVEKLQNEISNDYNNVKKREKTLQKKFVVSQEIQKTLTKENQLLKGQLIQYESSIKEKNEKLEQLENSYSALSRKYKSKPYIPYVVMESKYFDKFVPDHKCICHICGDKNMNEESVPESNTNIKAEENTEKKTNNPLAMNIDEAFKSNTSLDREKSLLFEIEQLTRQKNELLIELENKKLELNVSEERFLASKPYQLLMSQAEAMMQHLDKLKDTNIELHKQKIELMNQKEIDLKNYEAKDNEKRADFERKIEDLTRQLEEEKSKGSSLLLKIEYLKNEIESKNSTDFTSLLNYYESDKIKLNKTIDSLKNTKNDLSQKYSEEKEKNENCEKLNMKLNSEIERLKLSLKNEGIDPDNQNFQKFDIKEREEMKRQLRTRNDKIVLLEKKITKLKGELQIEKEVLRVSLI